MRTREKTLKKTSKTLKHRHIDRVFVMEVQHEHDKRKTNACTTSSPKVIQACVLIDGPVFKGTPPSIDTTATKQPPNNQQQGSPNNSTYHRNANVGTFQSRSVVDAVPRHAATVPNFTKRFHNFILVFGKDFGKTIQFFNDFFKTIRHGFVGVSFPWNQFRAMNVGAHAQLKTRFFGNGHLVPRNHFHINAQGVGFFNLQCRTVCRGIREKSWYISVLVEQTAQSTDK